MSIDPGKLVRVGVFHPAGHCAYCGSSGGELVETTIAMTRARAMRCDDIIACQRRRYLWKAAA